MNTSSTSSSPLSIDSPLSIWAIVYLAVIGPCVFILQPGFVHGLIEYANYDQIQSANIVTIDVFALPFRPYC